MKRIGFDYYAQFLKQAKDAQMAATLLSQCLNSYSTHKLKNSLPKMHEIEENADKKLHELIRQLTKEFIPPLERDDIMNLSQSLDSITDSIELCMEYFSMYQIRTLRPDLLLALPYLSQCLDTLTKCFEEFPHFKKTNALHTYFVEINHEKELSKEQYVKEVTGLFSSSHDSIELYVWSELYKAVHQCCIHCEHTANLLETIILRNS